jgi:hypothetical protein
MPITRSNKRKYEDSNIEQPSKKQRVSKDKPENYNLWKSLNYSRPYSFPEDVNKPEHYEWVSASSIRNYMLKDPLIDWLNLYYTKSNKNKNKNKNQNFNKNSNSNMTPLFEMGNQFEELIFEELDKKYPNDTIKICKNRDDFSNKLLVEKTLEAIRMGYPIIEQAMLVNEDNKTFGVADLLVRSDHLNKLFKTSPNYPEFNNYHYVIVDIKWCVLNLCANGHTLLNSTNIPAYKGQLAIYTLALGKLQHYIPTKAFILGKGYKWTSESNNGYESFDRCGTIDYEDFDFKYIETTADAVAWMRDVRLYGHNWNYLKPHRIELYPNMCHSDPVWDSVKSEVSGKLSELTQLWMVGFNNREIAHDKGIYSWKDKRCSAKNMNMKGKIVAPIVDKIINMNRDNKQLIIPKKIKNNTDNWQKKELDFYIDFETFNDTFMGNLNIMNSRSHSDICFRISIGYEENNDYISKSFIMESYTLEEEKNLYQNFKNFIEEKTQEYNKINKTQLKPKLYHWATAEKTFMCHANARHNNFMSEWLNNIILIDMCKVFTKEPIIVKGMMKFKLKEVAKAMYNNKMITTKWDEDGVTDGLSAMIGAIKYYKNKDNDKNQELMNKISKYNDIDVKVLYQIVKYLRENLI